MNKLIYLFFVTVFMSSCAAGTDDGWTDLFNGKDLTGWEQRNGEAIYEAVDGMIVGTTVANTPNSFLCTSEDYSDFVLELEMLLVDDFNSGMQFRSQSLPEYNNGRVHGYQCEVDPSDRAWSAGIYDEARRGWLYPVDLNPDAKTAFKNGEWNHYRIECIGPSIKTWLNGVPVSYVLDDMTPTGFIALQVHSIRDEAMAGRQIKWRNIRIKTENLEPSPDEGIYVVNLLPNNLSDAEKTQGFELLFDGNSTDNFKSTEGDEFPEKGWQVKDGELIANPGGGTPETRGGSIITKKEYAAFE